LLSGTTHGSGGGCTLGPLGGGISTRGTSIGCEWAGTSWTSVFRGIGTAGTAGPVIVPSIREGAGSVTVGVMVGRGGVSVVRQVLLGDGSIVPVDTGVTGAVGVRAGVRAGVAGVTGRATVVGTAGVIGS
jgi:hypothetical protein